MRDDIIDIVRTLCKLRTTQFGFRVYIEGKQLTNKDKLKRLSCVSILKKMT